MLADSDKDSASPLHAAVRERLGRVHLIGPNYFEALAQEQSDISDLRLRRTTDQLDQIMVGASEVAAHARRTVWPAFVDVAVLPVARAVGLGLPLMQRSEQRRSVVLLARDNPSLLHQLMSLYIDGFSAWTACAGWAEEVKAVMRDIPHDADGGHLIAACGNVQAVERQQGFAPFYEAALERLEDPWDQFFVCVRFATAALKKSRDAAEFKRICARAQGAAAELTKDDERFALCVLDNLRALQLVQRRRHAEAVDLAALTCSRAEEVSASLPAHVTDRYEATFRINLAVAINYAHGVEPAVAALTHALHRIRRRDVASRLEAMGLLALFLVRAGRPADAIPVLEQAVSLAAGRSGVTQLRELCRVAAVAHADAGHSHCAEAWLATSKLSDPRAGLLSESDRP